MYRVIREDRNGNRSEIISDKVLAELYPVTKDAITVSDALVLTNGRFITEIMFERFLRKNSCLILEQARRIVETREAQRKGGV